MRVRNKIWVQTRISSILVGYIYIYKKIKKKKKNLLHHSTGMIILLQRWTEIRTVNGMLFHWVILTLKCRRKKSSVGFHKISLFGLDQLVTSPTRITLHSSIPVIDHIYASDTKLLSNIHVPVTGISDHFPVCCTSSIKTVKPTLNVHSSIVYRYFKKFTKKSFFDGLACDPLGKSIQKN